MLKKDKKIASKAAEKKDIGLKGSDK